MSTLHGSTQIIEKSITLEKFDNGICFSELVIPKMVANHSKVVTKLKLIEMLSANANPL